VRWNLGVVDTVYSAEPSVRERSVLAEMDGFDHIDVTIDVDPSALVLPVGCPVAYPFAVPRWSSTPAPDAAHVTWDETVERHRRASGALIEPWAGGTVHSVETMRAFASAVPGVGFLVDTGHMVAMGEDPVEAVTFAAHIELRDARVGEAQVPPGEGDVDFTAVIRRLEEIDYRGRLSIEYFDLPTFGLAYDDPRAAAKELAALLRSL